MNPNLFKKLPYYLIYIFLFVSCNYFLNNTEYVKNSVLILDRSVNIGDALESYKYFKKTEWQEFTTIQGAEVVEFNGYYNQKNIVVRIQFIINKDRQVDADGVSFRVGFEGYKFLNQPNDKSKSLSSLMSNIYKNEEISWFSYIENPEGKNVTKNLKTSSTQLDDSNNKEAIKNEYTIWKKELILNGELLEKCNGDYQAWLKESESNPNLPHFAFTEPTVFITDINNDANDDALFFFTPDECDGGNAFIGKSDYAILIYSKDGSYYRNDKIISTIELKTNELILEKKKYSIRLTNTGVKIQKLENNTIVASIETWKEDDAHCCPFFYGIFTWNLNTNKFNLKQIEDPNK